jgi:hypothetical protein
MLKSLDRRGALRLTAGVGLVLALPRSARAALEVGRVAVLLGSAQRATVGSPVALQAGAGVREGDEITTAADSRMEIAFVDGSLLTLGPDSRVVIRRYAPDDTVAQAVILLVAGILKVAVGEGVIWQSFEVETETAVASVRATQWIMQSGAEGSAVFVIEGQVAVTAKLAPAAGPLPVPGPPPSKDQPATEPAAVGGVVLAPGQGTDVPAGALPTPPKAWGEARREAALARVAIP